jgi:hypothetical protein
LLDQIINKMPKQNQISDKKKKQKKNEPDSDSESSSVDSDYDSDDETVYTTDSDECESQTSSEVETPKSKKKRSSNDDDDDDDIAELHKTLQELFPSRYLSKKIDERSNAKNKQKVSKDKKKNKSSSKKKKSSSKKKKSSSKKKYMSSSEEDDDDDDDESDEYEDYESSDEDEDDEETSVYEDSYGNDYVDDEDAASENNNVTADDKNFKITLTIGGNGAGSKMKSSPLSNDEYGSDDEKTFMKENYEEPVGLPLTTSCQSLVSATSNNSLPRKRKAAKKEEKEENADFTDVQEKYKEIIELKKILVEKLRLKPNNKIVKKAIKQCNHSIQKLIKNARTKNAELYECLLSYADAQETVDELGYFKKKLSNKEQLQIMTDLQKINKFMYVEKPYRLSLLQSSIPPKFKAIAMQRLNQLNMMEPGENEYFKLKNWVDNFMRIPFGVYKNLTININDGVEKCSEYVVSAKKQLDTCVFGLNDAKMQIMQMVGQWISNPGSMGTAIAIHGPAGTGKTSLVKDGISKILGREFAFIALGGCGDSSFLEGHSYTYEGSTWGKIVQILIESKCMNPVIYFDELDKVSDTARGQEIIGILTHLTDTSQNNQFHDKYFSEIDLDLSKCLFIFSYNDENLVNPILRDRMYRIVTKGYEMKEKITIARNYMLPKIREQVGFGPDDIVIGDDVLSHIISNQAKGEEGVRNLKRTLEIIHTKLNLYRLITPSDTALFEKDMGLKVTFPHVLTRKDVDILVKPTECMNQSVLYNMYV